MEATRDLFRKELILKSNTDTKEKVLTAIGNLLYEKGLVKESFICAIIDREANYPTGIDLSPVAAGVPNVALPHTEAKHCKDQVIIFVKLEQAIPFNNMINPEEEVAVHYLFLIVNNQRKNQTNVLSELMGFITDEENMHQLDILDSEKEIYEFLTSKKGVKHND